MCEMQEIDDEKAEDRSRTDRRQRGPAEQRLEDGRERWFGDDADRDRGGGDADLTAREVDLEVLGHLPGAFETGLDELRFGVLLGTRQRELDGDEEAVREDQPNSCKKPNGDFGCVHWNTLSGNRRWKVIGRS